MKCMGDHALTSVCTVIDKCNTDSECKDGYYCNSKQKNCLKKITEWKTGCDQDSRTSCVNEDNYCGWAENTIYEVKTYCIPRTKIYEGPCMRPEERKKLSQGHDIREKQRLCNIPGKPNERCTKWGSQGYFCANN